MNFAYRVYWFVLRLRRANALARVFIEHFAYFYYSIFRRGKSFVFRGKRYSYFYHLHNRTIGSERVVEIPIAKGLVERYKGKRILEVGNVLSHYFPVSHDILDKYEVAPKVMNDDVADFKLPHNYDLIISISTMEHVGWTYSEEKEPGKFLKGIANLKKHLAKNGMLMVTFPLFYREDLSRLIIKRKMLFNREYFMQRVSFWNEWVEIDARKAAKGVAYDKYFANANVLYIGVYP